MVIEHLVVVRDEGNLLGGLTHCRSPKLAEPLGDDDFLLVFRYASIPSGQC